MKARRESCGGEAMERTEYQIEVDTMAARAIQELVSDLNERLEAAACLGITVDVDVASMQCIGGVAFTRLNVRLSRVTPIGEL